jgi:hypothetical protein
MLTGLTLSRASPLPQGFTWSKGTGKGSLWTGINSKSTAAVL